MRNARSLPYVLSLSLSFLINTTFRIERVTHTHTHTRTHSRLTIIPPRTVGPREGEGEEGGRGERVETERRRRVEGLCSWVNGLTLLAAGIIGRTKKTGIGIAKNSREGVEFHMKYTRHLLPPPAGAPAKTQTHYK